MTRDRKDEKAKRNARLIARVDAEGGDVNALPMSGLDRLEAALVGPLVAIETRFGPLPRGRRRGTSERVRANIERAENELRKRGRADPSVGELSREMAGNNDRQAASHRRTLQRVRKRGDK